MRFSICIPTLNEEKYLGGLLSDLTAQTHRDFEVVVADGQSTDRTAQIAGTFSDRLNLKFLVAPGRGVSRQRNFAAKNAGSSHLVFLDADTRIDASFLGDLSARLAADRPDFATSLLIPNSQKPVDRLIFWVFNHIFLIPMSRIQPAAIGAFIYVTRSAFTKVGGFPENISFGEDVEFARRLDAQKFRFLLLQKPAALFSTRRLDKEGRFPFALKMFAAFFYYYFRGPITEDSQFRKKIPHEFGKF